MSVRPYAWARAAVLPLGALAAGYAGAQTTPAAPAAPTPAASAAPAVAADASVLPTIRATVVDEPQGKDSVQATETRIGKGKQELRDIPQSITVVTEKVIDDRNLDTLKQALHSTAGVTFQAAEGGEEDIRVRGFSLAATGDLYVDGMRDPALYDRDTFNLDRLEVLRGSASMLFGRGSTGGVVNQVSKVPLLIDQREAEFTLGSGDYFRIVGDLNVKTGDDAAFRVNVMNTQADDGGATIDKQGVAPSFRWGIGTADEFLVSAYFLHYENTPDYGVGWFDGTISNAVDAGSYYGMASDYANGQAAFLNFTHTHRFLDGGELRTMLRHGRYERDFWASTIRYTEGFGSVAPTSVDDDTILYRGNQGRAHQFVTTYVQSDYSNSWTLGGMKHNLLTGIDAAREGADRDSYDNNPAKPSTTVGTPDDGARIADTRTKYWFRSFDSRSVGAYVQDMIELTPQWKVVGGLRYDYFHGENRKPETSNRDGSINPAATYKRSDSLWSQRLGVMYQPTALLSFHASYGTSFNTSGDTYSYDELGSNTPPEKSRNFELGAKLDLLEGAMSVRGAIFRTEKYNERNTDPDTAADQYLLSGKRHAEGAELDFAGRLTKQWELYASYAYTWKAVIDKSVNADEVGTNPGLTPRHSGSIWTTYQVTPKVRLGAGLNGVSHQSPAGNSSVYAPGYVIGEVMAEYKLEQVAFKLNVANVTDKTYGDQLYRGHYIMGDPRTVRLSITADF